MTSELLLNVWVQLARQGKFGEQYVRGSSDVHACEKTCTGPMRCVVCRTEMHLADLDAPPPTERNS